MEATRWTLVVSRFGDNRGMIADRSRGAAVTAEVKRFNRLRVTEFLRVAVTGFCRCGVSRGLVH
jgi:hypothetical protein